MNYIFEKKDLFYLNNRHYYATFKDELFGINVWTHSFNTFNYVTQSSRFGRFRFVDKVKQVNFFYDHTTYGYLYDLENQEYTKTSEFPYLISEIDGNVITYTIHDNKIYLCHSHTEDYDMACAGLQHQRVYL
jgi:hypothetical protein